MFKRPELWVCLFVTFLVLLSKTWHEVEIALYGFTQESSVDAVVGCALCALVAHNIASRCM